MSSSQEIEIKFRVKDLGDLSRDLQNAKFRVVTVRTHEANTLYDLPDKALRRRGKLLRLRHYGSIWTLTHKSKGKSGPHKVRTELETKIADGEKMNAILHALGYAESFLYEKLRTEWSDGTGHVVIDETPIGNFGEIEGPAEWIDRTAEILGIARGDYITQSYAELFSEWKRENRIDAENMLFPAVANSR